MKRDTIIRILATALFASGLICIQITLAQGQGTGRIAGKVYEKKTNEPLLFSNVVIIGTTLGGMTMEDGRFAINGVPVGSYTVMATMMGYRTVRKHGVAVIANETTELSFALIDTIVADVKVIHVFATNKEFDIKSSQIGETISKEDTEGLPIDNILDMPQFRSGVVKIGDDYHVHGGRPDEVQVQVEGVPVNDPLGGAAIAIGSLAYSGLDMITGGMDAEYGNAQSAVFNIKTREGGRVFGGEFRYITDDFGRADKTYTNYDNVNIGFGGPTFWKTLRYYMSAEATFLDGENNTIEPRTEHRNTLFDWIKARDRMSHSLNLQSKLSWHKGQYKVTGEAIVQRSRFDQYIHNWNIKGYVSKVYVFQRLMPTGSGSGIFGFAGLSEQFEGPWLKKVSDPNQQPNPRRVTVEQIVRDPATGDKHTITHTNFRAVDVGGHTILWDEVLYDAAGQISGFKPWVLFEGFQSPSSQFSNFQDDSSFVFFNSASNTPETVNRNLQLRLAFNHNITEELLYSVNVSRLEFNQSMTVGGKSPHEYSSAGLPVTMPDGTYLHSGVSQAVWYTDPDHPYFVTAYDYPLYSKRNAIQYLLKSDVISQQVKGHLMKAGIQLIYNDLDNDTRTYPAQMQLTESGTYRNGLNANIFHNFNTEGAAYFQDKWEYEGMVLNGGMRFEFFSTGNNDEIKIHSDKIDPAVEKYKTNWSPRLGFAFPITDRDKFFFHYGRFTQWPSRAYLFATQDAIAAFGTLGNPNLDPELTVAYQAGLTHQFTDDIAGSFAVFNKDIYGLVSSTLVTDDSTGIQSLRFVNRTYASARGLEVSLEKRLTHHVGFKVYYTYSFADGVASDADFGRSAEGLTHLPTEELPLDWDQRHIVNVTLRFVEGDDWGAAVMYQYGSGRAWTPYDRYARLQDPTRENSMRLPSTHRLRVQGSKKFNVYGRELTFFFEGRNLLDEDILLKHGDRPGAYPPMIVAQMDNGSYLTETGRFGGAYLQDIDDDGRNDFVPVNDPTIWDQHRVWRMGIGFEF
jgi:hypothetical protein